MVADLWVWVAEDFVFVCVCIYICKSFLDYFNVLNILF